MQWHVEDIPLLLTKLPEAVHHLLAHEDKALVLAAKPSLIVAHNPDVRHHISAEDPAVSIEKLLDPFSQRAAQNIGLLLHDYMYHLPECNAANHEGEKLLEHWRKILQEHPHHGAEPKESNWNTPEAVEFWRHRIEHLRNPKLTPEQLKAEWDDWKKMAGAHAKPLSQQQLSAQKARQWQDLVIRSRMHHETALHRFDN